MTDHRPEWDHVADVATVHRDRNSEIRIRLAESRKGYALELRKWQRSAQDGKMIAGQIGLMVPVERIAEVIAGLQRGADAATALRQAARA